jgi:hypothetical protein
MRATDQILDYLDAPKSAVNRNRYSIDDTLGDMRARDMSPDQLGHYWVNRQLREQFKHEESVFEELVRLARQADRETTDEFIRLSFEDADDIRSRKLAFEAVGTGVDERVLVTVAYGMLHEDGWAESEVRYALGTLGKA